MRMLACFRRNSKNSRRYQSSKVKKDMGQGSLKDTIRMEALGNGLLLFLNVTINAREHLKIAFTWFPLNS